MFYLMRAIQVLLLVVETVQRLSGYMRPYRKLVWQVITAERTRRILRAVGLAALTLGVMIGLGMVQVVRLAWLEAVAVFRNQLKTEQASSVDSVVVALPMEMLTPKTGVRTLRKVATQRGIRNAGRMKKAELLTRLEIKSGAIALEG